MVTIQCGHVVGQRIQHLADVVFLNCCQGFGATSFLYPYLLALGYLIAQSIVPVLPGFFMTWADYPIYSTYELAPRVIADFDAVIDQQTAAAVLQVGGMVLLWVQIAYRFLSWGYAQVNDDDRRSGRLHGAGTS